MDFRQIISFVEVADLKSFSKASEKLFITQPAVTSQIQKLEQELKTDLFDRSGRAVCLTPMGQVFYKYAKEMINIKSFATYELSQLKDTVNGTLVINADSDLQQYFLPKLIKNFLYLYPNVFFEINGSDSHSVIREIENGYCTLGIIDEKIKSSNLDYTELISDAIVLGLPPCYKHRYSPYSVIDTDTLKKLPLIFWNNSISRQQDLEQLLEKNNLIKCQLKVIAQVGSTDTMKSMIKTEIGAGFISQAAIENEIATEQIIPVFVNDLNLDRTIYLVTHKNRHLSVIGKHFKNFLLENTK